jgi:hypothetical protein
VIPTAVFAATATVEIGNAAFDAPPSTVTVPGTEATVELLLPSVMLTPAATAGPDSVTVPVEPFPPIKL